MLNIPKRLEKIKTHICSPRNNNEIFNNVLISSTDAIVFNPASKSLEMSFMSFMNKLKIPKKRKDMDVISNSEFNSLNVDQIKDI